MPVTIPNWNTDEESARFTSLNEDSDWREFSHVIQSIRKAFLTWERKGDGHLLCAAPEGPSRQKVPVTLSRTTPTTPEPLDLLPWGKTYLPDHFQKPPSPMHQWMAEHLDDMVTDRGRKLNVLGPRGGAKSTVATLAYPLREALHAREPYIWIISDTAHQARAHLDNLKAELLDNEQLARDYPHAVGKGPVWRAEKIVLRNGVTIEAFGTGQRIRGRRARANRPTLLICDDLQNDRHMESTIQRSHTRTWFHGTLLKAGTPQTNIINLATALHREALAMELTQTPGWQSRIFRSIDPWPFNTSLWEQWEEIYQGKGDGHLLCAAPEGPYRQKVPVTLSRTTSENPNTQPPPDHAPNQLAPKTSHPNTPGCHCRPDSAPPTDSPSLNPDPQQRTTNPASSSPADEGLPKNKRPTGATHSDGAVAPTGRQPCCPRREARAFYERHQKQMDAGAAVLWPQVEDLYTLMCLRAESGRSAFEREKQNSPLNPDLCEWPETYFTEDIWFDDWPAKTAAKVLALDPSKGGDAHRGDYSAFISLAVDRKGVLYVQADMARRPTPQMVADGVEIYRQFKPHVFGVEANQFQELLAPEFESAFCKQGLLGVHPWLIHNDANKRVRIRRLGPLLAARRIRLKANCPSTKLLLHQLQEFPIADHDDGPDALEMALRLATELLASTPNDGLGNRLPVG